MDDEHKLIARYAARLAQEVQAVSMAKKDHTKNLDTIIMVVHNLLVCNGNN